MNKRLALAWLVLFVAWFLGSFVVHGVLLHDDYMALTKANLFRPEAEAQKFFPLMILAHIFLAGAFVWIYARGVEAKPWLGQGLRFGVAVIFPQHLRQSQVLHPRLSLGRAAAAGYVGHEA